MTVAEIVLTVVLVGIVANIFSIMFVIGENGNTENIQIVYLLALSLIPYLMFLVIFSAVIVLIFFWGRIFKNQNEGEDEDDV